MIFRIDPGQEKEILNKYFNLVGKCPLAPASAATRRRSGAHPLMGAAGYRYLQESSFRWAHPRAIVDMKKFYTYPQIFTQ